jgi:4-aminobutyrate aminotransferase-like enzyme/Ser/Thr protein kinase RdoA (MazF antagonist)
VEAEVGIDGVLVAPPPSYSAADAVTIAARCFGVDATGARSLGSERDQTFLLVPHDDALAVMKVSNPVESVANLDMEAHAVDHALAVDPTLPLVRPWTSTHTGIARAPWERSWVRMYDVVPGRTCEDPSSLSDATVVAWGEMTARVARALRGFMHPAALRVMPWDVQHALATRTMVDAIDDLSARRAVTLVLDRFAESIAPRWSHLRAQVIHTDLNLGNVHLDERGAITGVVDFGDMSWSALVTDIASVISEMIDVRDVRELFRIGRLVIDGYQRITPLEPIELEVLTELAAARCAAGIAITSWRESAGLDQPGRGASWRGDRARWLDAILDLGWNEASRQLSGSPRHDSTSHWIARRDRAVGAGLESLSYTEPLHPRSSQGAWLIDVDGRRYLDAYNNVPCVGHAHPRVASAVARQTRLLNTNMRYLHESAVELAERLIASCPPSLDTVLFVNSGTEANDLAWRLAKFATGHDGGLCTSFAYHGISDAIAPFSPEMLLPEDRPPHVQSWHPHDAFRAQHGDATSFIHALERLHSNGHRLAATILDGVLQSDGVLDQPAALVQELHRLTREAGGLWIADEVQGGHGRCGEHLWSFERFGIEPDFVTLGKPMGNGFPVAAVITRHDIAQRFGDRSVIFSTFGGNPVVAAAALAVLDVIEDEHVIERTRATGIALRDAIRATAHHDERIGDVRGVGLANAIEIVTGGDSKTPDERAASAIKEALKRHGVLVGTTGPHRNVLKVRPPLAFTVEHVEVFCAALAAALHEVR